MTPEVKSSAASEAVEVLMSNGMEGLAGAVTILLNAAMQIERSNYLGVGPYERGDDRVNIELGENFYANFQCILLDAAPIVIGDDVLFGPGVHIYTVDHPKDTEARKQGVCFAKPVNIGNQVWIGGGAKVLPGVCLGDGAIIGANAVVTTDVAAHTVYQPRLFINTAAP